MGFECGVAVFFFSSPSHQMGLESILDPEITKYIKRFVFFVCPHPGLCFGLQRKCGVKKRGLIVIYRGRKQEDSVLGSLNHSRYKL